MATNLKLMWLLPLLIASPIYPADSYGHTIITRVTDRQQIDLPELANAATKSDVTLIGESHDNKDHHDLQFDVIRSMVSNKSPIAIGMEMMQADSQRELDDWVSGRLSEEKMRAAFTRNWSPGWEMYRDIFIFARENRIPMVALNVPIAIVKKVSRGGFASLTAEERKGLPEGTSCDLKNPQIALLRRSFKEVAMHGENGRNFEYFCEAQTVRNSGMAININRYLQKNPGRKMIVLTGIWHAIKYAIPTHLESLADRRSFTVILPETPQVNRSNTSTVEADYLIEL